MIKMQNGKAYGNNYSFGHVIEAIRNLERQIYRGNVSLPIENSIRIDILNSIVNSMQKESPTTLMNNIGKTVAGGSTDEEIADRNNQLANKTTVVNTEDTSTVLDEEADYKTFLGAIQSLYNILKGGNAEAISPNLPDDYINVIVSLEKLYQAIQHINIEPDPTFDVFDDMYNNFD